MGRKRGNMWIDTASLIELAVQLVPCVILLFVAGIAATSYSAIRAVRRRIAFIGTMGCSIRHQYTLSRLNSASGTTHNT
jgi:hypothetical protein